jgi:hypothetical protein
MIMKIILIHNFGNRMPGKTGQFARYIDDSLYARNNPREKYVGHLVVGQFRVQALACASDQQSKG